MENLKIKQKKSKRISIKSQKNVKFKPLKISTKELIKVSYLTIEKNSPLLVEPNLGELNLAVWAKNNLDWIEKKILKHGGILFRNFDINTHNKFEEFVNSVCYKPLSYIERSTPRNQLSDKVYTSTEFPPEETIALHNESSYAIDIPMKIWFFCLKPANRGGETPIADVRKVLQRIDTKIIDKFDRKGWMLVRNFGDGFGLSWQNVFQTSEKTAVENYCRKFQIKFEWKDNGRLRTRQIRRAIEKHPKTGEILWFNHAVFWHVSSLEPELRKMLLKQFQEEDLPYNTYYGDGSPIETSTIKKIRVAYQEEKITFPWNQGDILMLDNMLMAHSRNPFIGQRKILTAMGEPFSRYNI